MSSSAQQRGSPTKLALHVAIPLHACTQSLCLGIGNTGADYACGPKGRRARRARHPNGARKHFPLQISTGHPTHSVYGVSSILATTSTGPWNSVARTTTGLARCLRGRGSRRYGTLSSRQRHHVAFGDTSIKKENPSLDSAELAPGSRLAGT